MNKPPKRRIPAAEYYEAWFGWSLTFATMIVLDAVKGYFGRGWAAVVAPVLLLSWLIIRPWRFGKASEDMRHMIRGLSVIMLSAMALFSVYAYIRHLK